MKERTERYDGTLDTFRVSDAVMLSDAHYYSIYDYDTFVLPFLPFSRLCLIPSSKIIPSLTYPPSIPPPPPNPV